MPDPILAVRGLSVDFVTPRGAVHALRHVDLTVPANRTVGLVGESGCGKTTLVLAILRLLAPNAVIREGEIRFEGGDLLRQPPAELQAIRGRRIAMVFQDPMTSFNPVLSIAAQMTHIQYRDGSGRAEKRRRAVAMLRQVGIPDPEERVDHYPHQFSGGMRQRIAIAMALLMNPSLLIADEPTTALDVTLEAQIIHLLRRLRATFQGSLLFVSHNLGLIAELCDEVVVMYAGEVVEQGDVRRLFHAPQHPYTRLLLECDPARTVTRMRALPTIPGSVPDLVELPAGCIFAPRCPRRYAPCVAASPALYPVTEGHAARCFLVRDA